MVACEIQTGETESCASSTARLQLLVADEIISRRPEQPLPDFLLRTLLPRIQLAVNGDIADKAG